MDLTAGSPISPPAVAPPGWYPNPAQTGWIWWDGTRWILPADPEGSSGAAEGPNRRWFPPIPTMAFPAALLGLAVMACLTIATRIAEVLPQRFGALLSVALLIPGTIGLPLAAWYGSRRWGTGRFGHDLGLRFAPLDVPLAIAAAIGLTVVVIVVNLTLVTLGAPKGSNLTEISEGGRDVATFLVLFIVAGLVAPITEEIMFRGLILRGLSSRFAPRWAVILQGLVFGAAHVTLGEGWGNIVLIASLSATGIGLGFVARLAGRLGPTMLAHSLFNCTQLALLWITLP